MQNNNGIKSLSSLIREVPVKNEVPTQEIAISGVSIDSRKLESDNIFIAIPGRQVDGHRYIPDAIKRGAAAVVGSKPAQSYRNLSVPYLEVDDTRQVLAQLSAAWFDFPARKLIVIGVTGTDGKTTTVNLIYQILQAARIRAGLISTVNAVIGNTVLDTGFHVTTPEALDVQGYLYEMVKAGITHVVLEATSHGLAQKRVAACEIDIGIVTNITHEHLDFHGDYQGYLEAKSELLRLVSRSVSKPGKYSKIVVLNQDDSSYSKLFETAENLSVSCLTYSKAGKADFYADDIHSRPDGITFRLNQAGFQADFSTSLVGEYNVSNCLAAAAGCIGGLGISMENAQQGVQAVAGIPGRMEAFDLGQDFQAIVDFAHTPNALKNALTAARTITPGRVIAVFGSAGLRDREKRRLMAEVSADLADLTILTAEDPRTESLEDILLEMAAGMKSKEVVEGEGFWRVPDRGEAITMALQLAESGDTVIVCGKGHEQSMCFGETEYPWDDRTALEAALSAYLGLDGPEMPYLPTQNQP